MRIYTNILDNKYPKVKVVDDAAMIKLLQKSKTVYLDTETSAKNFNRKEKEEEFLAEHLAQGKKVTATTKKSAIKYAEDYRNECCLDPYRANVEIFQALTDNDEVVVMRMTTMPKKDQHKVITAICNKPIVGQNIGFDIKMLRVNYSNFKPGEIWDTMIGYKLHQTSRIVGFFRATLDRIIYYYTHIQLEKEYGTSDWSKAITKEQFQYCVDDVQYLKSITDQQIEALNRDSLFSVSNKYFNERVVDAVTIIEMKFVKVLADVELNGIAINIPGLKKRRQDLEKEYKRLIKPFNKMDLNPKSPAQLLKYFDQKFPDLDIMSTARPELTKYVDQPFIRDLLELKKVQKELQMVDDYIEKWPVNGRIYPSFNQMRAATGRMSSTNPNSQQFPRTLKSIIYYGDKKRPVIKADYPAIEARLMAVIANDSFMIKLFSQNKDIHRATASTILQKPEDEITKDERDKAKPVYFGYQYGMGAKTFREYSYATYGILYTMREAEIAREAFLQRYQGIYRLHQKNSKLIAENNEIIVKTLLGRKIRVDKFTNANNNPVQGSGADLLKLAATILYDKAEKHKVDVRIMNLVHDEIVCDCSARDKKRAVKLLKESMEIAADYVIQLFHTPIEVEEITCQ